MSKVKIIVGILVALAIITALFLAISTYNKRVDENEGNIVSTTEQKQNNSVKEDKEEKSDSKIAVVYFSATGNTKDVAETISKNLEADIIEIVPKTPYTSEDLNYDNDETRATKEQNDDSARPELKEKLDLEQYDTVLLGYPIWWGDVPKIILSLIDSGALDGKTVIPFCTSGSSSIDKSVKTLKEYSSKYELKEENAKRFGGSASNQEITSWTKSLDVVEEKTMEKVVIEVNGKELELETEDNQATKELLEKLRTGSITVEAEDYGDFEKIGNLGFSLTKDDKQIETDPGDVVLYQGNKISIFYAPNAWEYTKLGKITNVDKEELKSILGDGDITFEIKIK